MKKLLSCLIGCTLVTLTLTGQGFASSSYDVPMSIAYSGAMLQNGGCAVCHVDSEKPDNLTVYGQDFKMNENNLSNIENIDSDRDGVSNIAELLAFTNPNDPLDVPRSDSETGSPELLDMVSDIRF